MAGPDPGALLPPWHEHRLPNGLRVLVCPVGRPATSVRLQIDAGAADELPDEYGLAHLLEHMLFKGTPTRAIGASARDVEAWGGDLNAWTSHDQTCLYATVDADGWRAALDVIADMVRNPLLEEDELRRELDVVCEEIRAADADPESLLSDLVQAACWPDHPYGRRILGTESSVRSHTVARLRGLLQREYGAARSLLIIAGPVDAAEVVTEAERALGQWTAGAPRRPWPIARRRGGVARLSGDWSSTAMEITWPLPPAGHPDLPALEVLAHLLGLGAGALLSQIIQHEEALAFNVWAECASGLGGSTFALGFVPLEKSGRKALERTFDLLDEIKVSPRGGAVDRARGAIVADFLFGGETVDQLTQDLAHYASHHGDPAAREAHRQALAQVSVTDVRDAARAWLGRDAAIIGVLDDGVSDAAARKLLAARAPVARKAGPVVFRHPKGPLVRIVPEDSPVVAVRVLGRGGDLRATDRQAGIGEAWSRLVLAGAGRHDPAGLGEAMDSLAAEVDPYTSRHALGFAASAPASHALELLDLLSDVVLEPHLEAEELDRVREELLDDVRTQADRPSEVAANMTRAVRWAGHPWRLPTLGTEATLQRLTADGLRTWHQHHLGGQDMVITVVGGVDPEAIQRALAWLDDLPGDSAPLASRPAPRPRWGSTTIARAGNEQAHLVLFGEAPGLRDDARFALELATTLLDGQAGRLFLDLRERAGLAYDVWAQASSGLDGGTLRVGLATDPDRVEAAAAGLRRVLLGVVQSPPAPDELERARRQLAGRAAIDSQRASARAAAFARRDLLGDPPTLDELRARLAAVTPADVVAVIARLLAAGTAEVRVMPRK